MREKNNQAGKKPLERRKAQRLKVPLSVQLKLKSSSKWIDAECMDVSGGGLKISTQKQLKTKDEIEVFIRTQDSPPQSFTAICSVRWVDSFGSNKFLSGLEFNEIKEKDDFLVFMCDKLVDECV